MRTVVGLCLILLLPVSAVSAAHFEWPYDLNGTPAANSASIKEIGTLVNRVLAPQSITAQVRAFRFVPLETPKRIDLIASIDTSGRGMFNAVIALWQFESAYKYAILPSERQGALARDVIDLRGTGVYQVVAGRIPGGYQGFNTDPIPWYGVYALREGKWIDVSDKYPQLYEIDISPRLGIVFHTLEVCLSGDQQRLEIYRDQAQFVRFKYDRHVTHTGDAGLSTALDWADSEVPAIQILAVEILGEYTDATAITTLKRLMSSQDLGVRSAAASALTRIGVSKR